MGGPCNVEGHETPSLPCTDNFQIKKFVIDGKEWQSVEQCFQAIKFGSEELRENIRAVVPEEGDTDRSYGMKCFQAGRIRDPSFLAHWDGIRAECMYRINRAKFAANADAREALVNTGSKPLQHPEGGYWGVWNTNVMRRLREELKPADQQDKDLLAELEQKFKDECKSTESLPSLVPLP